MNSKFWIIILDIFSILLILISAYIAARGKTFDDNRKKYILSRIKKSGWWFIFLFILGNVFQYTSNHIKSNNDIELREAHKQELLEKYEEIMRLEHEISRNATESFKDLDSINNIIQYDNDTLKSELKTLRAEYISVLKEYNNSFKDKKQNLYINFQSEIRQNRTALISKVPALSYNPRIIPDHDLKNDAAKNILAVINNQELNRYIMLYIEKIDDVIKYIDWADYAQKNQDSIRFFKHKENIAFLTRQIQKQENVFECSFSEVNDIDEFSISEEFMLLYNDSTGVGIPLSGYCDKNLNNLIKRSKNQP